MLSNSRDSRVRGFVVDRHVRDRHPLLAGLDDRLERVGELRDDRHPQRGLARVGAEPARRVGHASCSTPGARPSCRAAAADACATTCAAAPAMLRSPMTMSASPRQQRREQLRDVVSAVLVVGVGVDDEVGARLEATRRCRP